MLDSSVKRSHSPGMRRAYEPIQAGLVPFQVILLIVLCAAQPIAGAEANDVLSDTRGGHWLAQTKDLGVWWCESGWKVGRERDLPERPRGKPEPVSVSAARGEFEPVQVVLRPERDGELLCGGGQSFAPGMGRGGAHFGAD